jgi:hypothetical protein
MAANPLELFAAHRGLSESSEAEDSVRDRRRRARTTVHWQVQFFRKHTLEAVESLTENLSSEGFYCHSNIPFATGELLMCTLRLPRHDAGGRGPDCRLECEIRVMRVEPGDEFYGVACRIEEYRVIQSHAPGDHGPS